MNNFDFLITEDKSVGLYSKDVNDIFHSKSGALKEAFDKFIIPSSLNQLIQNNNELTILDICYGIGYNTKSALSVLPMSYKLNIDCLEYNNDLILLSPFIKDNLNRFDINLFLFSQIKYDSFNFDSLKTNYSYFDQNMIDFINFCINEGYVHNGFYELNSFLHNIYYKYITNSMKQDINFSYFDNVSIKYYIGDARTSIQKCNKTYDVVFLDAFSPQKDPTLWTIDFLSLIKEKMNNNSVLVSYSKSTPFRSALKQLGFCVGKTFIDNVDMGTVASFNKEKILNPLSSYDNQLLETRSGITYKDKLLKLSGDEILRNREIEQKNSSLISHTQFLKNFSK